MFEITDEVVIQLNKVAIKRVADCLGIVTDNKTFTVVFSEISDTEDPLFNLLDTFISTYRQYQNFHIILEQNDFQGIPRTQFELDRLENHILRRDETRQALIDALAIRGC